MHRQSIATAPLGAILLAAAALGATPDKFHATPRAVSETMTVTPGQTAWIGITYTIDPGWHIYWDGQNDSGMPPEIKARTPEGWRIGEIHWPAPSRYFASEGILDHVYEDRVTLLIPVDVPETARPGRTAVIHFSLLWLVCADICLPEETDLHLRLLVGRPGERTRASPEAPLFEQARARLPRTIPPGLFRWNGRTLEFSDPNARQMAFYPRPDSLRPVSIIDEGIAEGGLLAIRFREGTNPIDGVLEVWPRGEGPPAVYRVHTEPPRAARPGT